MVFTMIKDTELKKLNEIVQRQKIKYNIKSPPFSYRFDGRTGKLIFIYSTPELVQVKGKIKIHGIACLYVNAVCVTQC